MRHVRALNGVVLAAYDVSRLPERANQREKGGQTRRRGGLAAARRADPNQLSHEQSEIEASRVNQQSLQNVRVAAQVHAAHPTGFVEMRKGSFQALAAAPQQPLSARAANASSIAIHGVAGAGCFLPVPPPRSGSEM